MEKEIFWTMPENSLSKITLHFDEAFFEIEYKVLYSNRRTIALEVKENGEIIVRAPSVISEDSVLCFIRSKSKWISNAVRKTAAKKLERQAAMPLPITGADGDKLPYIGKILTLLHVKDEPETRVENDILLLPENTELDDIAFWLRGRAEAEFMPRLQKYSGLMNVSPSSVRLSDARSRWGMCSGKNSINLSWRLVFCRPDIIDYVVAHELCHIIFKNHGKAFYAQLELVYPKRRLAEKWLRENSMLLTLL